MLVGFGDGTASSGRLAHSDDGHRGGHLVERGSDRGRLGRHLLVPWGPEGTTYQNPNSAGHEGSPQRRTIIEALKAIGMRLRYGRAPPGGMENQLSAMVKSLTSRR